MKPAQMTNQGLLRSSLKTLIAGGMAALICMATPAWANLIHPNTLVPLPKLCFIDNNGNPLVTSSSLSEILVPGTTPTITPGVEQVDIQFYVLPVFMEVSSFVQSAVILTQSGPGGPTPLDILILSVDPLLAKNSVDLFFADNTAANFSSMVTTWEGKNAPMLASTGSEQDLSSLLYAGINFQGEQSLQICVGCGQGVPDSGTTVALLGLALACVLLMHRLMPRLGTVLR